MATRSLSPKKRAAPLRGIRVVKVGGEKKLELRSRLGMTRDVFSRLVDVSVRAIADVEAERKEVPKLQRPYREVARLYDALTDVIAPAAIGPWFVAPNEAFEGLKPLEIIERGEIDRLWDMAYRLRSGLPG